MRTTALQGRGIWCPPGTAGCLGHHGGTQSQPAPDPRTLMQAYPQQVGLPAACSMPALFSQLPKLLG